MKALNKKKEQTPEAAVKISKISPLRERETRFHEHSMHVIFLQKRGDKIATFLSHYQER
jgi:hypothetical protein